MKRTPHSPWLEISLDDYERHMSATSVAQSSLLADTLRLLVERYRPASLALLGSAGGNGLEYIDPQVTRRVVAVDISAAFLEVCAARHSKRFDKFEPMNCDLSDGPPFTDPVELSVAFLVIEYVELDSFLDYAPSLVTKDGRIAFVFQNHDGLDSVVTDSGVLSVQALRAGAYTRGCCAGDGWPAIAGDGCRRPAGRHIRAGEELHLAGYGQTLSGGKMQAQVCATKKKRSRQSATSRYSIQC